jgi:MoaA/NifB/PqqE/SkfB family radical SAM enzyme
MNTTRMNTFSVFTPAAPEPIGQLTSSVCEPDGNSPTHIHNYVAKLRHPTVLQGVMRAVRTSDARQSSASLAEALRCRNAGTPGPVSINLDLTVACNYRCPHCIDGSILNTGKSYGLLDIVRSLVILRLAGLRSVILIGGGEPTLHPKFCDAVRVIKLLGLQCAIVSNGSNNARLQEIAPLLTKGDWIRLSLDAATDQTFRVMHLPRKASLTLKEICESAREIKRTNPNLMLGFSYIVSWRGASVFGQTIEDNVEEMVGAAHLAKASGFDFIAFKPLLDRDEIGAETITIANEDKKAVREALVQRISSGFSAAKALEDEGFRVFGSLNLLALNQDEHISQLRSQPRHCHMRLFRQVLTPIGVFGCPAYRGNRKDQIGLESAYTSVERFFISRRSTYSLVETFDASVECRNIACIYNSANWWLQAIRDAGEDPQADGVSQDFFL